MLKRNVFCIVLASSVLLAGCYKDNAEDLYGTEGVCSEDPSTVYSYADDVEPVIALNCAIGGCHAAGNGTGRVPLTTFDEVKQAVDSYDLKRRVEEGSMPLGGSLAPCDRKAILQWVEQGVVNN
jgi:hypothetical protein